MSFGLLAWDALPNRSRKHAFPVSVKMHLPVHNLWPLYRLIELIRLFPLKWLDWIMLGPCTVVTSRGKSFGSYCLHVLSFVQFILSWLSPCPLPRLYWLYGVSQHDGDFHRPCIPTTPKVSLQALLSYRSSLGFFAPKWKFIVPLSPWFGGWWERLIRSIKTALRKTVGVRCLTRGELETTLHEVEACVNSRPLTFVSTEPDIENPLTPSHFLLGHGRGYYSRGPEPIPAEKICYRPVLASWLADYIRNLPPWKGSSGNCQVKIGSVVLVEDVNQPRLKWPLGLVTQVFQGEMEWSEQWRWKQ